MFERVPRRWYVGCIELQRFRARDESVAARDRRLRRHRGARLHCGSLGLVSDGGCTDCQRECRCDCVHPHLFTSYAARPDLTHTCQHKALAVESLQLVKREHHNPTPDAHLTYYALLVEVKEQLACPRFNCNTNHRASCSPGWRTAAGLPNGIDDRWLANPTPCGIR